MRTLEEVLGDSMLEVCPDELRCELETEVSLLVERYLTSESRSELAAAARAFTPPADVKQNTRTRLWAAVLRRRAAIAGGGRPD